MSCDLQNDICRKAVHRGWKMGERVKNSFLLTQIMYNSAVILSVFVLFWYLSYILHPDIDLIFLWALNIYLCMHTCIVHNLLLWFILNLLPCMHVFWHNPFSDTYFYLYMYASCIYDVSAVLLIQWVTYILKLVEI